MLKQLDKDFTETLDDESKFERRLAALTTQRRLNTITAVLLAALIYAHLLFLLFTCKSSISAAAPFGINTPTPILLMSSIMFPLLLINTAKAVAAHGESRTLLSFKKLRDMPLK